MRRVAFIVSFELPDGADRDDAQTYVEEAVSSFQGSLRPPGAYGDDDDGDPMFCLNSDSVRVRNRK